MKNVKTPKKDHELPVTKRFLDLKIQEVKGDITSHRLETKAGFTNIDARFKEQESKFVSIDARFQEQNAKFDALEAKMTKLDANILAQNAKFESLDTKITKMMILLEDQNDRNRVVMDSYTTVYENLTETNTRVGKLEVRVFGSTEK